MDGRPEYIFVRGGNADYTLAQFYLYHPVIVDYETYKDLTSEFKDDTLVTGMLTVKVKSLYEKGGSRVLSAGVDPSDLLPVELERGYKAKISLSDGAFYYLIKSISIDVVMMGAKTIHVFIPPSYMDRYEIVGGNLYFTESIEDLLFEVNDDLEDEIQSTSFSKMYYKVHIKLGRVIPFVGRDSANAEVQTRMALAQNIHYAIMEYFNQYTFAKTTASMIDEIGYTALMTAISTAISSAVIALGSYLSKGIG